MEIDSNGDGVQRVPGGVTFIHSAAERTIGRNAGSPVRIATLDRLIELRAGYEPRAVDRHDLALLRQLPRTP